MSMRLSVLSFVVFSFVTAEVRSDPTKEKGFLKNVKTLELYSISPKFADRPKNKKDGFHGWKILGKTTIKDAGQRRKVTDAILKGIKEGGAPAKCFIPRHGIRTKWKGKTVDLVICFQCSQIYIYHEGVVKADWKTTSKSPQPVLNKILKDAGIPLAN